MKMKFLLILFALIAVITVKNIVINEIKSSTSFVHADNTFIELKLNTDEDFCDRNLDFYYILTIKFSQTGKFKRIFKIL